MSRTVSDGLVDASHWTGMASALAHYLEAWLRSDEPGVQFPKGQCAAASRFFTFALEGIELDRRKRPNLTIPVMAGISNLAIAVDVIGELPHRKPTTNAEVESVVRAHLDCLRRFQSGEPREKIDADSVRSLCSFLRKLEEKGDMQQLSLIAAASSPLV
jgi:hypothetical protein